MADRALRMSLIATLAWGVFSFGAVYPWAYWPLMTSCVCIGVAGFATSPRAPRPSNLLMGAMALCGIAVAVQLLPLPTALVNRLSPPALGLVKNLDLAYALQPRATHALSIEPYATERGLAIALALSAFFIGLTRFLSRDGARWLATSVAVIGFIVSLVGIIQKPFFTGKIYGFWSPIAPAESFGPFINKNHFAGWMLMALPLSLIHI